MAAEANGRYLLAIPCRMASRIAVLGATGHVGSRVARMLADRGHPVRGVHLRPDHPLHAVGVEEVTLELADPTDARRALEGAEAAYLAPPEQGPDPLRLERRVVRNVVRAAAEAGVGHLVVHTALHAERPGTGVPLLENKRVVEETVRDGEVPWTLVRPGLFLDTLLAAPPHERRDTLVLPFPPEHPFGAVAVGDVAAAVAGLLEAGPQEAAFDLHGPAVSGQDLAHVVGRVMERTVRSERHPDGSRGFVGTLAAGPEERLLHKVLYDYVGRVEYVGDPEPISGVVPGFRYATVESFVHDEWAPRGRPFTLERPS